MKYYRPQLVPHGHHQPLLSIDTHPSGRFATAGANNRIRIWNLRRNHYHTLSRLDSHQIQVIIDELTRNVNDVATCNEILTHFDDACGGYFLRQYQQQQQQQNTNQNNSSVSTSIVVSPTTPIQTKPIPFFDASYQIAYKITQLKNLKESLLKNDLLREHFDFLAQITIGQTSSFGCNDTSSSNQGINCLRFSPNGQLLAVATVNKTIEIWSFDHHINPKVDQDQEVLYPEDDIGQDVELDLDDMSDFASEKWTLVTSFQNNHHNGLLKELSEWIDLTWTPDSMGLFAGDSNGAVNYFSIETKSCGNLSTDKIHQPFNKTTLSQLSKVYVAALGVQQQYPRTFLTEDILIYKHEDVNVMNDEVILNDYLNATKQQKSFSTLSAFFHSPNPNQPLNNPSHHLANINPTCVLPQLTPQQALLLSQQTALLYASTINSLEYYDKTHNSLDTTTNYDKTQNLDPNLAVQLGSDHNNDDINKILAQIESRVTNPFIHSLFRLPYQDYCLMTQTPITDINGLIIDGAKGVIFDPDVSTNSSLESYFRDLANSTPSDFVNTTSTTTATTSSSHPPNPNTNHLTPITSLYDSLLPTINFGSIVNRYFRNETNNDCSVQRPLTKEAQKRYLEPDSRKLPPDHPLRLKMEKLQSSVQNNINMHDLSDDDSKSDKGSSTSSSTTTMTSTTSTTASTATTTTTTPIVKRQLFSVEDADSDDDDFRPALISDDMNDQDADHNVVANEAKPINTTKDENSTENSNLTTTNIQPYEYKTTDPRQQYDILYAQGMINKTEHTMLISLLEQSIDDDLKVASDSGQTTLRGTETNSNPISLPMALPLDNLKAVIDSRVMVSRDINPGKLGQGSKVQGLAMDPLGVYLAAIYESRQMYIYSRNPYNTAELEKIAENDLNAGLGGLKGSEDSREGGVGSKNIAKQDQVPKLLFFPSKLVEKTFVPANLSQALLSDTDFVDINDVATTAMTSSTTTTTTTTATPLDDDHDDDDDKNNNNNRNGDNHPLQLLPSVNFPLFRQETAALFFRRPDWSPDGLLLAVPGGILPSTTLRHCIHIYSRTNLSTPLISLPTFENHQGIVVKFNRVPFIDKGYKNTVDRICQGFFRGGNSDGSFNDNSSPLTLSELESITQTIHPSITGTAYYYLMAVGTTQNLTIYRTDTFQPIIVVRNPHTAKAAITDLSWFNNGMSLISVGQDGLCTFITLENEKQTMTEKQLQYLSSSPFTQSSSTSSTLSSNFTPNQSILDYPIITPIQNDSKIFHTTDGEIMNGFSRFVYDLYLAHLTTSFVEASHHNDKYRPLKPGSSLQQHTALKDGYDMVSHSSRDLVHDLLKTSFSLHYFLNNNPYGNALDEKDEATQKTKSISNLLHKGGELGLYHPHNNKNPINRALDPLTKYLFGSLSVILKPLALNEAGIFKPTTATPKTKKSITTTPKHPKNPSVISLLQKDTNVIKSDLPRSSNDGVKYNTIGSPISLLGDKNDCCDVDNNDGSDDDILTSDVIYSSQSRPTTPLEVGIAGGVIETTPLSAIKRSVNKIGAAPRGHQSSSQHSQQSQSSQHDLFALDQDDLDLVSTKIIHKKQKTTNNLR